MNDLHIAGQYRTRAEGWYSGLKAFVLARPWFLLIACSYLASAADELTVYELLAPATHGFAITYDVATNVEGSRYLFNPIRRGSVASEERVVDAASGKPLHFEVVTAETALQNGMRSRSSADQYIQVTLAHPVPKGGEGRVRIYKTYTDAASYGTEGANLAFQRSFGIKRNVIVLPRGYELTGCSAPGIVTTQNDGRVRVSFFNDRDDELMVKLQGRALP